MQEQGYELIRYLIFLVKLFIGADIVASKRKAPAQYFACVSWDVPFLDVSP